MSNRFCSDSDANWTPLSILKSTKKSMLKGIQHLIDFRMDALIALAPTWSNLGQVGTILALKIVPEPPEMPPKTLLAAGTRPDHP